jgi:Flp pilus assembly pilin Flp
MTHQVISSIAANVRARTTRRGQSLVEYALILSFISVLTIAVMSVLGVEIRNVFQPIISALNAARIFIGG